MKGIEPIISVALLILIAVALVVIINTWAGDTVRKILNDSTSRYYNTTKEVLGSFFNIFRR